MSIEETDVTFCAGTGTEGAAGGRGSGGGGGGGGWGWEVGGLEVGLVGLLFLLVLFC
jgi:hypothetical protein